MSLRSIFKPDILAHGHSIDCNDGRSHCTSVATCTADEVIERSEFLLRCMSSLMAQTGH